LISVKITNFVKGKQAQVKEFTEFNVLLNNEDTDESIKSFLEKLDVGSNLIGVLEEIDCLCKN
jgi:hypothetical protein